MKRRSLFDNMTARGTAFVRAMAQPHPRLSLFRQRAGGTMSAARPASLPLLAALAALAVAAALFAIYVYPAHAQEGSAPDKPTSLDATATHGQVFLTWDDPDDDSITGYVILRRVRVKNTGGDFSELVANTGSAATTYTDNEVAASTTYTYRIKAINQYGASKRSRWSHIDTPAAPASRQNSDEPMDGDFAASTETTAQVVVGQSIVGRISTAGDVDWILVAGRPRPMVHHHPHRIRRGRSHATLETPYQQAYHQPDGSVMVS